MNHPRGHGRGRLVQGACMGALLVPSIVHSQETSTPPAKASPTSAATQQADPYDIVVTARRSAERLQQVPIAITAVSPEQVKALNLTDTRDLVKVAPSLGFTQGSTTKLQNFVVRGVGTFVNSDGFDQSVGVAFDGVSLARPGGSIADLIDIERVEILEGPQGMLFGRNASAGLINIISKKPELGSTSLSGRFSYGSYNEVKAEAVANIPLGNTVAARLVAWHSGHDGYVHRLPRNDDIGSKNSHGIRLQTLWEPSDAARLTLMGEYVRANQDPVVTTIREFTSNAAGVRNFELGAGIVPGPGNETTSSNNNIFNRSRSLAFSAEGQYDLNGPTLTVLGAYRNIRVADQFDSPSSGSPVYLNNQIDRLRYHQSSIELRLNSDPASKLKYVGGLIYYTFKLHDAFDLNTQGAVPTPVSFRALADQNSKHYGIFGEVTYPITSGFRAILGARRSWDRVSADFSRDYLNPPVSVIPPFNGPGAAFGPFAASSFVKDSEWSYRAGLQLDVARDVLLYSTISRGYKAAGNDIGFTISSAIYSANQLRVAPEISHNYEVGLRSQFLDRRLTFNLTAFHEVFSDFQISARAPLPGVIFTIQNAKQLKSTGASASLDARLGSGITLSGSAAYVNARYTDYSNGTCYPGEPAAPAGTALVRGLCVNGSQSLNGLPLQNAPKWRANAAIRYQSKSFGPGLNLSTEAGLQYLSNQVFGAVADPRERQSAYTTVNLSAGIGSDDGRWRVSVFGTNIFDQKFISRTIVQIQGAYYINTVPFDARARWGAALEFKF